jgi:hypothetical protein
MSIRIDAEAICDHCGVNARCTLDLDIVRATPHASHGGEATRGLPSWYYKGQSASMACSAACLAVLERDKTYAGLWKPCQG